LCNGLYAAVAGRVDNKPCTVYYTLRKGEWFMVRKMIAAIVFVTEGKGIY